MQYTRRELGKLALAGVPATYALLKSGNVLSAASAALAPKPDSKWAGVQVGMNVPYNFSTGNYTSGDEILHRCVQLNISYVELRAQPVELFLGSPAAIAGAQAQAAAAAGGGRGGRAAAPGGAAGRAGAAGAAAGAAGAAAGARGAGAAGGAARGGARADAAPCVPGTGIAPAAAAAGAAGGGAPAEGDAPAAGRGGRGAPTAEQLAAQEATKKWRMGVSMDKVKQFRKTWNDAGVTIDIIKWDGIFDFSDDEIDYAFEVSKALGARALSSEITIGKTKRLGQFADKHKMPVGYHGHTAVTDAIWEAAFAEAKYNYANVDLGHYVAGNNKSPVPFIKKHPDRITHVHVKDRKYCNGPNVEFGQGDTPIKEVLQLMHTNKWAFDAIIEFEIPGYGPGDARMAAMAKCVEYCKNCLVT